MVHVYVRADGLASVLVSDAEYPQRVAHTLLSKVCVSFCYCSMILNNKYFNEFRLWMILRILIRQQHGQEWVNSMC